MKSIVAPNEAMLPFCAQHPHLVKPLVFLGALGVLAV